MWWCWRALSVVVCACVVLGQNQRVDQDAVLASRSSRVRDRTDQNAANSGQDEPTCEQLKAMWRFSKRQARAPEIMNEVSSYRDPLLYNEWPAYNNLPRAAPRFRYQYNNGGREAYGRIVTKAPPNVVRTPDYDEMYGILNTPHNSGKILRYPGPSKVKTFMVPPQRNRFEALKKLVRQEHVRELQRKYETDQKQQGLKDITSGGSGDDYAYSSYINDQETRGRQQLGAEYAEDDLNGLHLKKPTQNSRQLNQFSRYSDVMLPPARRNFYQPYFEYPEILPYY